MQQGFIKYIALIIVILLIVFFSQQAYSASTGKALISDATDKASAYLADASNWTMAKIYPKVDGAVQNREGMIKKEVTQEKQKVSENIGQKISNYFSGVANSVVHPGTPQNCQPTQAPTK